MSYNPKDYEEVKDRITRFYKDHPDGRIVTENLTTESDRSALTWVVKSYVYLSADDQREGLPKATGLAFEIDGKNGMANKTSALENCETSSIGRSLANAGYSGSKNRASAEEMAKVERGVTPSRDWIDEARNAKSLQDLRKLYADARKAGVENPILATITDLAEAWTEQAKTS